MEDMGVEIIEIHSIHDFERICDIWKTLEQGRDMTIFQSYNWNILLYEEERKRVLSNFFSTVVVIQINKNGVVVGLLPMVIQKHTNITKWFGRKKGLYILGHNSWSDYLNLVYDEKIDSSCFAGIIDYLGSVYNGYTFYITDVREHTKFSDFLKNSGAELDKTNVAVQVEKMSTVEEYERSLSKHVRQNLRTARNRMDKAGIEYELKVLGMTDDEALINQLIEVHVGRMAEKNTVTTDLLHKISSYIRIKYRQRQEYKNNIVTESMKRMKESCLVIVYLNGDIAGYLYGLRDGGVIRIMQNCVKNEYKFYSPLFRGAYDFILEQYSDKSVSTVDFTRGDEQYKYSLGGSEINLISCHFASNKGGII